MTGIGNFISYCLFPSESVGTLCEYTETSTSETIRQTCHSYNDYFSSLDFTCQQGEPARVVWTPDHNTPDVVYYQVI